VTETVAVPTVFSRPLGTVTTMEEGLLAPDSASCVVLLAKVQLTIGEAVGKLVPLKVRVRSLTGLMNANDGLRVLMFSAELMTKFTAFEVTPIAVLVTETVAVPAVFNNVVGTVATMSMAVSVEVESVVVTPLNVQLTRVLAVGRLVPVRLRVTAFGCSATAVEGERLVRSGPEPTTKFCVLLGSEVGVLMTPT